MKLVILILVVTTAFSQDYDELIQKGYDNLDNYEVALESFEKAKFLADEGSKEYGKACYYIGVVKKKNLEYEEAIQNFVIAETLLDGDELMSYVYLDLSGIYYEYQDYKSAIKYLNSMQEYTLTSSQMDLLNYKKSQIYYMLNDYNSFISLFNKIDSSSYYNKYKLLKCNFLLEQNKLIEAKKILDELTPSLKRDNDFLIAKIRLAIELNNKNDIEELLRRVENSNDPYYEPYLNQIKGEIESNIDKKNIFFNKALSVFKKRNQIDRIIDVLLLKMRTSNTYTSDKATLDSLLRVKNQNLSELYNIYFITKNNLTKTIADKEYIQKLFYYYIIGSIILVIVSIVIYYYRKQIKFLSRLRTLLETKQNKLKHSYDHEITPDVELLQLELLSSNVQSDIVYERLDKLISDVNNQRPIYN